MRKTLTYTVTDSGRDQGKAFLITEMSAADAEDWALRAFFALMNSGIDIPDEVADMGFAGIATVGLKALGKVEYAKAKPLFDDMMTCVQVVPDPGKPNVVRSLIDTDIEEVTTRLKLRSEVFKLHTDFLAAAAPSITAPSKTDQAA